MFPPNVHKTFGRRTFISMNKFYAVAYFISQPYVDDPEIFLLLKLFDFIGNLYTACECPELQFVPSNGGVLVLGMHSLAPTIEESPPRIGFPFRSTPFRVEFIRQIQCTFRQHVQRHPSALHRLSAVLRNTSIIGNVCSDRRPSLPHNVTLN